MGRAAKVTRRALLFGAAAAAGGLAVGTWLYRRPYPNPLEAALAAGVSTFNPYLTVGADETVTVFVPRAEMGQGVRTTLAALVAEELDVDLAAIAVEHGPAAPAYANTAILEEGLPFAAFDETTVAELARAGMAVVGKFLALQVTGGSSSTIDAFDKMRHAGAMAREMLKAAAAERFGADAGGLETAAGIVRDPASGETLTYGTLAASAAGRDPPRTLALRPARQWRLLGRSQPRNDMMEKVTGAPIFGIDVALPGMLHATVRMNPHPGGTMRSLDPSAAEGMRGVVEVVALESVFGEGFAVIADNTWRAMRAAEAVAVEWTPGTAPASDEQTGARLAAALDGGGASRMRDDGDVDIAFADAPRERVVEAEYRVPFLAHATMEPMNATARLADGVLDLWSPNQAPTLVKSQCAAALGIAGENCRVHTTFLGGGFGRRGDVDYAILAALVAEHTHGRPVKVTWSREEDITRDVYRPAALGRLRARLGADGRPEALDMRIAAPSINASVLSRYFPRIPALGPDKAITDGAHNQPYRIAHYRVSGTKADLGVPVGFWRSVGNSYNGFFHECFIDEIAAAGGRDPLDLRLELTRDWPVATAVLERVADMSGWRAPPAEGRARGLAFTLSFGTWVAEVVEVSAGADGRIRIERVWCAADLGTVLDPGIVEAQLMSGIVFGLSSAVGEAIGFENGRVRQSNFHDLEVMRMPQCPSIEVALLENSGRMGGAGEPGTPPAVPALANAVHALTGRRIRTLPLAGAVTFA